MKKILMDTVSETINLGTDSLKFNEMVKFEDGKLKSINGETIIVNNAIMDRITVSEDGTTLLFDGAEITSGIGMTAEQILADLPLA